MNTATATNIPTLHDELCRKALEAIEKIGMDEQHGRITKAQRKYAVDVLWVALAGIADADFMAMMELLGSLPEDGSRFTRHYLRNKTGDIAKITNMHDGRLRVENFKASGHSERLVDYSDERHPAMFATNKCLALRDKMIELGYEEV